nr:hypothetical protein [Acrocarpospora corrugata]
MRRHLGAKGELSTGAGTHQAHTLDAAHLGGLGPLAPAHVHLGVVEAERLDLDDDLTGQGLGFRQFPIDKALRPAELLDHDRTHDDLR